MKQLYDKYQSYTSLGSDISEEVQKFMEMLWDKYSGNTPKTTLDFYQFRVLIEDKIDQFLIFKRVRSGLNQKIKDEEKQNENNQL